MRHATSLALAVFAVLASLARAQEPASRPAEVYTKVLLSELEKVSGEWPDFSQFGFVRLELMASSHVILNPQAEGFFAGPSDDVPVPPSLVIRSPQGAEVAGALVFHEPFSTWGSAEAGRVVRFRVPKALVGKADRKDFLDAGKAHFEATLRSGIPGGAWFRHRLNAIEAELGTKPPPAPAGRARNVLVRPELGGDELQETYDFFSAGRAVSENLRLDRSLIPIEGGEPTIPVESILGIDTKAFDWKAAIAGLKPVLDPLAALIPEDQHGAFFRHLADVDHTVTALETQAAPLLVTATERPEEAGLRSLYETQLGFRLKDVAYDPVISAFVKSVAVTGSDPYFATGTDVAVLIEAAEPAIAYAALELRQKAQSKTRADATVSSGDVEGSPYSWLRTDDRALSSIVARVGPAVVVTNSLAQLKRIVGVTKGSVPRLSESPEYVFFRNRYAITYVAESAFVLLTDATIRRWCGPRWRIGDARRTRAAAQLAGLTAENADAIVRGLVKPGPLEGEGRPGLGALRWTAEGVHSEAYGSLRFLTPIIETDVSRVTKAEADAYDQFRQAYQRRWAQFFDPIAIRFATSGGGAGTLSLDVTVMPVVASSDYRELMEIVQSARFAGDACDPHDGALVHFAIAVDGAASAMADWERGLKRLGRGPNPEALALAWLKGGVSVCLEKDPIFQQLDPEHFEQQMFRQLHRLPLILTAEVKEPVALALVLAGIRANVEDMGGGSVRWVKGKHRDAETMTLAGIPVGFDQETPPISIRYAIVDGLLIVTLREDLLHQAIDRRLDRRSPNATAPRGWLGESAAIRVDKGLVDLVAAASERNWDRGQREIAWRALPILQEWRRLFPDQDPVAVHEKLFKVRLVDPAGGRYVVGQDGLRIVSETYGSPAETRPGPKRPSFFEGFKDGRAGLTFENDGVRARLVLEREK